METKMETLYKVMTMEIWNEEEKDKIFELMEWVLDQKNKSVK